QLANQTPGATYNLRVTSANPTGSQAVGGYLLTANLAQTAVTNFDSMTTATLNAYSSTLYSQVTLDQGRLVQFTQSASTGVTAPAEAVRMTVVDSTGHAVFTLAAE